MIGVIWKLTKEDNLVTKGELSFVLEGHQGKNCWSFDFVERQNKFFILTGGGDCSIRFWCHNLNKIESEEIVSVDAPQVKEPPLPTTSKSKSKNSHNKQKMINNMKKLHSLHFLKEQVYITTAVGAYCRSLDSVFHTPSLQDWISLTPKLFDQENSKLVPSSSCSNSWSDFFILGWNNGYCTIFDTNTPVPHKQFTWKSSESKVCSVFEILGDLPNTISYDLRLSTHTVSTSSRKSLLNIFTFEFPFKIKMWQIDISCFDHKNKENQNFVQLVHTFEENEKKSFQINKIEYSLAQKILIVGDSSGNIKIFKQDSSNPNQSCFKSIKFVAHKERVTDLLIVNDTGKSIKFLSTGSEGDISTYLLTSSNENISCERINHTKGTIFFYFYFSTL